MLKPTRNLRIFGVAVLASVAALHVWSLMRYPPPFCDEAWLISRAWAFIQTGRAFGPLDAGIVDRFEGYWVVNQWLITVVQSLVLRLSSTPSLLLARGLSLLWGAVLLAANYGIAHRLGGRNLAWGSTLLLALSRSFFFSAHQARYDIMAAALGYGAFALVLNNRAGRFRTDLLAGVLVGLAVETHLNSLIFVPAILAWYLVNHGWQCIRKAHFWGLVTGGVMGGAFYLILHVLPYPQTFFAVTSLVFGKTHQPPLLTLDPQKILWALTDTWTLLAIAGTSVTVLAILALPVLLFRRSTLDHQLLVLSLTLIAAIALIMPAKREHYAILATPALTWLAGAFLIWFAKRPWRRRWYDYVSRGVVLGLAAGGVFLSLKAVQQDGSQFYRQAQAFINQNVRPGDTIIASQLYWLGLYDHKYYSWELLFLYPLFYPGKTLADAFQEYKPNLFIIDRGIYELTYQDFDPSSFWYNYHLPRDELMAFLDQNAELVGTYDVEWYSPILIYRINGTRGVAATPGGQ